MTGVGDAGWREVPPRVPVFQQVAGLYGASETRVETRLVEAGPSWRPIDPGGPPGVTVWGNLALDRAPLRGVILWGARRELALVLLRRRFGAGIRAVHRLGPPVLPGRARGVVRRALRGGLLVELHDGGPYRRVIDEVAHDAGAAVDQEIRLRVSRDGSALARIHGAGGEPLELRVAVLGGRKDPGRNAAALQMLMEHRVTRVPRLVARGSIAGAVWTTEHVLSGRRPHRLTSGLADEVSEFCAGLPTAETPLSLSERMQQLAQRYPRWAEVARQLASRPLPPYAVLQHGDLWIGNLLTRGERLTGVVDWDTWHPAGMPGVDLLQLLATERRRRTGHDIGAVWLSGLWRSDDYIGATGAYWRRLGIRPKPDLLEAVALDWWAGQLFKRQVFAADAGWVERNVDDVLASVSGAR